MITPNPPTFEISSWIIVHYLIRNWTASAFASVALYYQTHELMSELHLKIKAIRILYQLTQEETADKALMTLKTYRRKEMGFSAITELDLQKIAGVYNLSVEDIRNFDPGKKVIGNHDPDQLIALKIENENLKSENSILRQLMDKLVTAFSSSNRTNELK
ncbi:MAG: helix-turn-helix transcriptional regulator [Saprospiraceae bacterium]|nr:helix-turn-helix transcriptional regulator [Saprospiraceae bacterium]